MDNLKMPLCQGIIDSHAHYFDRRFENEYEGGADAVLNDLVFKNGIEAIVNVGTNPENSMRCIEQAAKYEKMYAAVGIHPEDTLYLLGEPDGHIATIRALLSDPTARKRDKIVALGEIGLDYHYEGHDKQLQAYYFEEQMKIAEELRIPVIIHDREAHGDCFDMVLKYPNVKGVFHSFSGSAEMATELTKRGWYISFSGVITFKNARRVKEAAAVVQKDRILIETDSPYLSPEPNRGRLNHSANLCYTASALGEACGESFEEIIKITNINAKRLFGI